MIPDRSVGAIHASISFRRGKFCLTDLNSPTGTYTRVPTDDGAALERGDIYLMGGTEMIVYSKDNDNSSSGGKAGGGNHRGCCAVS